MREEDEEVKRVWLYYQNYTHQIYGIFCLYISKNFKRNLSISMNKYNLHTGMKIKLKYENNNIQNLTGCPSITC